MIEDLLKSVDSHIRMVLMRHGQDTGTVHGDTVRELCETGIEQAQKSASFLEQFSFDQLYCSDHLRAQQTLGIVDLTLNQKVRVSRKLREVSPFYAMGDIELTKEQVEPIKSFLKAVSENSESGTLVLAATHSHLIRYILSLRSITDDSLEPRSVNELYEDGLVERKSSMVDILNASFTVVDISKAGLLNPRLINFTDHL